MKRSKTLLIVAALTSIGLCLAGCTSEVSGISSPSTASVATTPSNSAPDTSGAAKAPKVTTPLDASKFVADPCLTLTDTQRQQFDIKDAGQRNDVGNGVACAWIFDGEKHGGAGVSFATKITNGLSNAYQLSSSGYFKNGYFEPASVDSYPAVFSDIKDDRTQGKCHLLVGISDQLAFGVSIEGTPDLNSCKAATNVAQAVLNTMKAGQ